MEILGVYLRALDAFRFLLTSDLGFADSERLVLETFACEIADKIKDSIEVVSK